MTRAVRRLRGLLAVAGVAATLVISASGAFAQDRDAGEGDDPSGRSTSFQAVTGPTAETVAGGTLLLSAYAVVWVLVALYVGRLAMASGRTARDLARLETALAKAERDQKNGPKGAAGGEPKREAEKGS